MEPTIQLRDKRKPGFCWQENELYDCFAPIIGANAMLVYVYATRTCYGAEMRASSRELATSCGLSADSVQRALGVMEIVGMVRRVHGTGGARRRPEYHLVDLKELAQSHGATFDPKRYSYTFTEAQASVLRLEVTEYLKKRQRKTAAPPANPQPPSDAQSVSLKPPSDAQSVSLGVQRAADLTLPAGRSDAPSSSSDAPERQLSSYRQEARKQQTTKLPSPTPPVPGGERKRKSAIAVFESRPEILAAADEAMRSCSFVAEAGGERIRSALIAAIALEVAKRRPEHRGLELDAVAAEIGRQAAEQWRQYLGLGKFLRFTWGPAKFFVQGHWLDWHGWPIDQKAFAAHRDARVGMR